MDHLSVSDKNYDKKYNDMQERIDKLYDEITDIEDTMEEVETRYIISGRTKSQKIMFTSSFYSLISCMINLQIWKRRHF